jgi:hypothetical protein
MIHGAKPSAQGQFGRRENRSGDRRSLSAAFRALKQAAARNLTMRSTAAEWARKPIRPPARNHDRPALLLCAVQTIKFSLTQPFLKLDFIPSHRFPPPYLNVLVLYHRKTG